jgi:signal transduction histidine kinase
MSQNSVSSDLELLVEVSKLFTLEDLDSVLRSVIDVAARTVGATDASLVIYENDRVSWRYFLDIPPDDPQKAAQRAEDIIKHGLAGWVLRNRQIALLEDTQQDPRWYKVPDQEDQIRSALCIPLIYQDTVVAIITVVHPEPGHFTASHQHLLTVIANQAAVAIFNARLFSRSRAQQRELESILHAIPDVLLVLDSAGRIIVANQPALTLAGADQRADIIGQRLQDIPDPDDCVKAVCQTICDTEDIPPDEREDVAFEIRSERLKQDYQVIISHWKDSAEGSAGYIVLMHDVTTLRDLHRFKDEMLRLASHDLRSPLALIVGYANMISLDTPEPHSPVHDYVKAIQSATTRMSTLLEEFLRVEQVRTSPLELHEEIDPHKLVKIVLVNSRYDAEKKHLALEAEIDLEAARHLVADPLLLRQAMENLVGNAIKYTPEGGQIMVRAYADSNRFYFAVEDNGLGIPEENLPYVFDSFYRVPHPEINDVHGTGLGLNLVKNVVERHGGEVWAQSEQGKGSRFGFWLPLNVADRPAAAQQP